MTTGRGRWLDANRGWMGKVLFEIAIVFVGVTAAFALESARQDRSDTAYRKGMVAAMIPTLDDTIAHDRAFLAETEAKLAAFDRDLAAGRTPLLPIYREPGGERPPTRAWDGLVASGVSRVLPPDLYFDLSLFYNRQDSFGEKYVRYAVATEQQIDPLGPEQRGIYDEAGRLRPAYAAYVQRLRDLVAFTRDLDRQALALKRRVQAHS